jgi:hypothetical protein
MSDARFELDDQQFEELRPLNLGPIATQKDDGEGLTEEDWWFHFAYDSLWYKCTS